MADGDHTDSFCLHYVGWQWPLPGTIAPTLRLDQQLISIQFYEVLISLMFSATWLYTCTVFFFIRTQLIHF